MAQPVQCAQSHLNAPQFEWRHGNVQTQACIVLVDGEAAGVKGIPKERRGHRGIPFHMAVRVTRRVCLGANTGKRCEVVVTGGRGGWGVVELKIGIDTSQQTTVTS